MTEFTVKHSTVYRYGRPVEFGEHRLMFRPRDSYDQRLLTASLAIDPEPSHIRWIHDVFGNCVALVTIARPDDTLSFETEISLEHTPQSTPDFRMSEEAASYPLVYAPDDLADLAPTIQRHYEDPADEVGRWAKRFLHPGGETQTATMLMTLCYAIRESFAYGRRTEMGTQTPIETLHKRRGTCRDFALFMMEAVRSLGLAARFVSGYIYVPDRDGSQTLGGGATHAWCQVYLPGAGWVEFDPTNGIVGNRDLIRVAVARDPRQAIPLSGSYHGLASDFSSMTVQVNVTTAAATIASELLPTPLAKPQQNPRLKGERARSTR
nr:transglutaminase family protein [Mangrovicella endophytica]